MTLDEYQEQTCRTACYPELGDNILYPALKLAGEAGEFAEKVGKYWRNSGTKDVEKYTDEQRHALAQELGDCLWYIADLANSLGFSLEAVANANLKKLADRARRGVIKSEGDNR